MYLTQRDVVGETHRPKETGSCAYLAGRRERRESVT